MAAIQKRGIIFYMPTL